MSKRTKEARTKVRAAAGVLGDMSPPISADGRPGLPDEPQPSTLANGKPGLPEPEPEPVSFDCSEEDAEGEDEPGGEPKPAFTGEDRKALLLLEKRAEGGLLQSAKAIREIRQRQLWRLAEDDHGQPLNYASFEEYCQDRLGHTRQWVTHLTNWLRIREELDALGFPVPHLTVKAAQGLLTGRLQDAGGLRAVLEEAKDDGVPLDRDHLREIVVRRADYSYWSKDGTEGVTKPAAKSYADYKQDLAAVRELGGSHTSWDVVKRAQALDGEFADNLVSLCQQEGVLPTADSLLAVLTGEALKELVRRLNDVGRELAEITEKKARLKELNQQLREGQKKEREERKSLEQELKARGVLKVKTKPPQDSPSLPPSEVPPEDDDNDATVTEAQNQVSTSLQTALESLDEALSWDWPGAEGELNAILLKAQECEDKLAEVIAKAKELLADVGEPETVNN